MAKTFKSKWIIEYVTDAEKIYAAIRYLDPEPRITNEAQDDGANLVIAVVFVIVMLGFGFLLLYR